MQNAVEEKPNKQTDDDQLNEQKETKCTKCMYSAAWTSYAVVMASFLRTARGESGNPPNERDCLLWIIRLCHSISFSVVETETDYMESRWRQLLHKAQYLPKQNKKCWQARTWRGSGRQRFATFPWNDTVYIFDTNYCRENKFGTVGKVLTRGKLWLSPFLVDKSEFSSLGTLPSYSV